MNLIILASGRGSRLNRITIDKPKCLTNITINKTLLDFTINNIFNEFKK